MDDYERIDNLRKALSDIANGMIPARQRARQALKEDTDVMETAESWEHARS